MQYANRPVKLSEKATDNHLKGIALRYLGRCQGKSVKLVSSNLERSLLQAETLNSLGEAILLDKENPDPVYDLGLEYAKWRNINAALICAKDFIDPMSESIIEGWRLLSLVLSAHGKYSEAEVVVDVALDETSMWDQGPLLRIRVTENGCHRGIEAYNMLRKKFIKGQN
jgi:tetratricopeptide repeat protein 7